MFTKTFDVEVVFSPTRSILEGLTSLGKILGGRKWLEESKERNIRRIYSFLDQEERDAFYGIVKDMDLRVNKFSANREWYG